MCIRDSLGEKRRVRYVALEEGLRHQRVEGRLVGHPELLLSLIHIFRDEVVLHAGDRLEDGVHVQAHRGVAEMCIRDRRKEGAEKLEGMAKSKGLKFTGLKNMKTSSKIALVILVAVVLISILAPIIAPYDPYAIGMARQAPDAAHIFGTCLLYTSRCV